MMSIKEVKEMPGRREHASLQTLLREFMTQNVKYVEVIGTVKHYRSIGVARGVIGTAAKRLELPIKVHRRNDKIYLERTDM